MLGSSKNSTLIFILTDSTGRVWLQLCPSESLYTSRKILFQDERQTMCLIQWEKHLDKNKLYEAPLEFWMHQTCVRWTRESLLVKIPQSIQSLMMHILHSYVYLMDPVLNLKTWTFSLFYFYIFIFHLKLIPAS